MRMDCILANVGYH